MHWHCDDSCIGLATMPRHCFHEMKPVAHYLLLHCYFTANINIRLLVYWQYEPPS